MVQFCIILEETQYNSVDKTKTTLHISLTINLLSSYITLSLINYFLQ
jgi:hypothetical protein